jgi:amidase
LQQSSEPEVTNLGAAQLARLIRDGKISSAELLDLYLERIAALNPHINALVLVDADRARADARAFDDGGLRNGDLPLGGLPVSVKDSIEVAGWRTTSGARRLTDHVPLRDAVAVERLRAAGAIPFGKSNLPPYAGDYQTFNPLFGVTNNPWDLSRTVGGSSGGSAAAVAASLTGCELGSDISGSMRNPAHFCGVYAHKPSYGIVPYLGHIPGQPGSRIPVDGATIGPLARCAEDLLVTMEAIAGPYGADAAGWSLRLPPSRADRLADFRVASYLQDDVCPVSEDVRNTIGAWIATLRAAGGRIEEIACPPVPMPEATALAEAMLGAAISLGVRDDIFALACAHEATSPQPDEPGGMATARHVAMRHRTWLAFTEERERQRHAWHQFFREYDLLVLPAVPVVAFPHDLDGDRFTRTVTVGDRTLSHYQLVRWCNAVGVAYLPVTAVPAGLSSSGLPVGAQIVGPYLADLTPMRFAVAAEMVTGPAPLPPCGALPP